MVEETSLMMLTKTRCDSFYLGYLLVKAFVCSHHWSKGFSLFLHFFLVVKKSFTTYHLQSFTTWISVGFSPKNVEFAFGNFFALY